MVDFLRYWGKADPKYEGEPKWHPLAYHCLDVAAVAKVWLGACPALQGKFLAALDCMPVQVQALHAWILFFVAMHDLGKLDLRFQLKAPEALAAAWRKIEQGADHEIPQKEITRFDHGHAGIAWARLEYPAWLACTDDDLTSWSRWKSWLAAVIGHHGDYCPPFMEGLSGIEADEALKGMIVMRGRRSWSRWRLCFFIPRV